MNTFGLLFHPVGGCRRINDHPTWLLPLVVVSLLGLIAAILIMPFGMKLTMFKVSGLPADQIQHSMDMVKLFTYAGIALTPIVLLVKWAIVAVIIYLIGIILNAEARFKSLFALIAHANIIIVLSSVANAVALRLKDPQSILNPFDMNIIGLHRLFDPVSTNRILYHSLAMINLFEIWYLVVLGIGLKIIYHADTQKATAITILFWILTSGMMLSMSLYADKLRPF